MSKSNDKTKIAILGGGVGAITAAFELTSSEQLRQKNEVTIYQLGWRLGGKGASGRSEVDGAQRVEEHGLHILMGCYENSFRLLRQCYKELNRPDGTPLQTMEDAVKPQSLVVAEQKFRDEWYRWSIHFPEDTLPDGRVKMPGDRDSLPGTLTYIKRLLQWVEAWLVQIDNNTAGGSAASAAHSNGIKVCRQLHGHITDNETKTEKHKASAIHSFGEKALIKLRADYQTMLSGIDDIEVDLLRVFMLVDLSLSCIIGAFKYNLFFHAYDSINHFDFREWLLDCGAAQETVDCPIITVLYELVFAYEGGRSVGGNVVPNMEAGTIMRALPHMMLGYTGAFMWKMQSAMGDTIFAPMYQVLKQRGVKFKFFHKVTNLHVNAGELVAVDIVPQVNLKQSEYDPLIPVTIDGYQHPLPAWPSHPRYEQIFEGDKIQADGVDLESFYTSWVDTGNPFTLKVGDDFDQVVLGISVGSFPYLCSELINSNSDWKNMVQNVKTVQTQAAQFWLKPSFKELGFDQTGAVVGNIFESPLDTAADMSYLIEDEGWTPGSVEALVYFTGPMEGPDQAPPSDTAGFVDKSKLHNESVVTALLDKHIKVLLPDFEGDQQIVSCYQRVNISPSERYVMSVKDSSKYRLKAGEARFKNLVLAGDWTECRINMGCVEAAAISGMQASQKLCGFPKKILLYPNRIL